MPVNDAPDAIAANSNGTSDPKPAEKEPPTAIRAVESKPPTKPLPIERISFGKQLEILRAYDAASGQSKNLVGLAEVGELAGVKSDTVSLANRFFVPVGLILKADAKFRPSDAVHEFAVSVGWKDENAAHKLAQVFEEAWFWTALKPSLTYGPMQVRDVLNKLALACDAAPKYEPQLQMLITYMEASGLIAKDGTVVTLGPSASGGATRQRIAVPENTPADAPPAKSDGNSGTPAVKSAGVTTTFTQDPEGALKFAISVNVTMSELSGWQADRIAALFAGVAQVLAAKGNVEQEGAR